MRSMNSGYCDLRSRPHTLRDRILTKSFSKEINIYRAIMYTIISILFVIKESLCTTLSLIFSSLRWLSPLSRNRSSCPPAHSYARSGVDPTLGRLLRGGGRGPTGVRTSGRGLNTYLSFQIQIQILYFSRVNLMTLRRYKHTTYIH